MTAGKPQKLQDHEAYLANAVPGDFGDVGDHQCADNEQRATHSIRWDVRCRCAKQRSAACLGPVPHTNSL